MDFDPTFDDLHSEDTEASLTPTRGKKNRGPRLVDDLDTVELEDRGDDLTEGSSLSAVFEDPELLEEEEEEAQVDDAEIADAENLDLSSFSSGRDRGYDLDAFEDWVRLSRKYGNLTPEQSDRYVRMMQSGDEELQAIAEDRLVAHSVKWIVKCLNEVASRRIMETPGDLRNDALSAAREGFLIGLRKYDPKKAEELGAQGHKKSVLGFTKYWIRKIYLEWYYGAVLNLNADAAEDRKKVVDAERAISELQQRGAWEPRYREPIYDIAAYLEDEAIERLAKKTLRAELRRKPTDEEFEARCAEYREELEMARARAREQVAQSELAAELGREPTAGEVEARVAQIVAEKRWVDYPVSRPLRRAGALTIDRIRDLRSHSTVQESFDAPAQDDDQDGPKLREYIASSDVTPEEAISQNQLAAALNARLNLVAGSKARDLYRQRYGFGPYPNEQYPTSNPEELMYWMGRSTRDSVATYEDQVAREMRGEVLVDPDALTRPGYGFSPNSVRQLHEVLDRLHSSLETAERDQGRARGGANRASSLAKVAEARAALAEAEGQLEEIRQRIRARSDLRRIALSEGVGVDVRGNAACILQDGCDGTLTLTKDSFSCSGCGRTGDIFDWIEARSNADPIERDVAAARAVIELPQNVERQGNAIVAVRDPHRRRSLKRLTQ